MGDDFSSSVRVFEKMRFACAAVRRLSDFRSQETTIAILLFGAVFFGCVFFSRKASKLYVPGVSQQVCQSAGALNLHHRCISWSQKAVRAFVAPCVYSWIKNTASMIFPFVEWIIRAHDMPKIISNLGSSFFGRCGADHAKWIWQTKLWLVAPKWNCALLQHRNP